MIFEPLRKKNGQPYSNVEINNFMYDKLCRLRDGVGLKTEAEKRVAHLLYLKICGGSSNAQATMDYMKQIHDIKDPNAAQQMLQDTLIAVIE